MAQASVFRFDKTLIARESWLNSVTYGVAACVRRALHRA
jgi:hypothetical protein